MISLSYMKKFYEKQINQLEFAIMFRSFMFMFAKMY